MSGGMPIPNGQSPIPPGYGDWLRELKSRIQGARARAVLAANQEQIRLYHDLGREILARIEAEGWGRSIIERLSADLRAAFPEMRGLSARNLWYMRQFASACPDLRFLQQPAAELPWFHIVTLLTALKDDALRGWYASAAVANGWSRDTLVAQIRSEAHRRDGAALTNFARQLPEHEAGLVQAVLKDPYHFDFLGLGEEAHERDIESALMRHVTRFLLELGQGFAFLGRQMRLEVDGREFFIDLLFYHTRLKRHVVVELKAREFDPADAGQLSFYLAAVDAQLKASDDRPTIGLLLCKSKRRLVVEYALSGSDRPMGVAEYQLVRALPEPLDTALPSIESLEAELSADLAEFDSRDGEAGGGA
jgi:predicted nuclease of restriction endonuclease-like (RecB) superfamily